MSKLLQNVLNTSLAAPGALAHRLKHRTTRYIKNQYGLMNEDDLKN